MTLLRIVSLVGCLTIQAGIVDAQVDPREAVLPAEVRQLKADIQKQQLNAERRAALEMLEKQKQRRMQQAADLRVMQPPQVVIPAIRIQRAGNFQQQFALRITTSNGNLQFGIIGMMTASNIAAQNELNRKAICQHFMTCCDREIERLAKFTQITELQREKLRLAATGMSRQAFREAEELNSEVHSNQPRQAIQILAMETNRLNAKYAAGLFADGALFAKVVKVLLADNPEWQNKRLHNVIASYESVLKPAKASLAAMPQVLDLAEANVEIGDLQPLSEEQRGRLIELLSLAHKRKGKDSLALLSDLYCDTLIFEIHDPTDTIPMPHLAALRLAAKKRYISPR